MMRRAAMVAGLGLGTWVIGCPKQPPPVPPSGVLSPLEALGMGIYKREGCGRCHPNKPGPQTPEEYETTTRLGLADRGGMYPDLWHYYHFQEPTNTSPQSEMPAFGHLLDAPIEGWSPAARAQAESIAAGLAKERVDTPANREVIALIAYIQSLVPDRPPSMSARALEPEPAPALPDPTDPTTRMAGAEVYQANCASCHGADLEGGVGPNLKDDQWTYGGSLEDILRITREGKLEQGMLAWESILSDLETAQVAAYVYARSRESGPPTVSP